MKQQTSILEEVEAEAKEDDAAENEVEGVLALTGGHGSDAPEHASGDIDVKMKDGDTDVKRANPECQDNVMNGGMAAVMHQIDPTKNIVDE